MNTATKSAIAEHGRQLLAIFPRATERDPVNLCRKLRRLEREASAFALRGCNGPEWASEEEQDREGEAILRKANDLLGNTPLTVFAGGKCSCKRGQQRDNCPACEGTGKVINFPATRRVTQSLVPVILNRDPRGYALKISDKWMSEHNVALHRDWGGYGIIAPEIGG